MAIALDRHGALSSRSSVAAASNPLSSVSAVRRRIAGVWALAFLISSHQLVAEYPEWPEDYSDDVICPISKVGQTQSRRFNILFARGEKDWHLELGGKVSQSFLLFNYDYRPPR